MSKETKRLLNIINNVCLDLDNKQICKEINMDQEDKTKLYESMNKQEQEQHQKEYKKGFDDLFKDIKKLYNEE